MKINLGCGLALKEGYENVDIIDYPGVIKVDMLDYLKGLQSDTVSEVFSNHAMEHISRGKFLSVFIEILRVCKNGALIELFLPYYTQGVNLANPYHLNIFNEHTFRFFCKDREDKNTVLEKEALIQTYSFGLYHSANEAQLPGTVEILSIHYSYFDWLNDKSEEEKLFARMHYFNTVKEFHIKMKVIK